MSISPDNIIYQIENKVPGWLYDPVIQVSLSFVFALILAPFSSIKLKDYIIFLILYEIAIFAFTRRKNSLYDIRIRVISTIVSIAGFLLGKYIVSKREIEINSYLGLSMKPKDEDEDENEE